MVYSGIEELLLLKYKKLSNVFCPKCQNEEINKVYPKCILKYGIISYPVILFIIFDLGFNELKNKLNNLMKYTKETLLFEKDIKYNLIGIICI